MAKKRIPFNYIIETFEVTAYHTHLVENRSQDILDFFFFKNPNSASIYNNSFYEIVPSGDTIELWLTKVTCVPINLIEFEKWLNNKG